MASKDERPFWWGSATFRITHSEMDPSEISNQMPPATSDSLGKLEVTYGRNNKKMAYWFGEYRIESPNRPDVLIAWAENFAHENKLHVAELVELGCTMYVYVGIHTNVLAVGFDLPPTPTLWELNVPIGVEFFSN